MASSDSVYIDEDVYSRESTDPGGIVQATGRERIFVWHSFLDLVLRADVPIITPSEFEDGGVCRILGRGATMVVSERVLKASQSRAGGGVRKQPAVVAVKQLIVRFADSEDYLRARPQHEIALLANFTLELRALCHGALRSHVNIVRLLGITWAEKGLPALVVERASEHVPTLQSLIENRKLRGVQKADVLAGIADGLGAIHLLTLVHGDLKPSNVLIFEQGTNFVPKLSDFAFSRSWKESLPSGGTEYWNAPECCEFGSQKIKGDGGHPSYRDVFSLGLMFSESGYLLEQLSADRDKYAAFMFETDMTEATDDDDAILSIVECMNHLLHPQPSQRLNRFNADIPGKLRTRRRLLETSDLTWDGEKMSGDVWSKKDFEDIKLEFKKDIEDIKLEFENRSKVETSIRYNLYGELGSASRTSEMPRDQEMVSSDVSVMMKTSHDATLQSKDASKEERAEAAWYLAQLSIRDEQSTKGQELLLEAAKLGNHHAQVNYLYTCFRKSAAVLVDELTHKEWLIASLTGKFVFKKLETCPPSPIQKRIFLGFQDFYAKSDTMNKGHTLKDSGTGTKHEIAILHEAFVRDVLGGTYPPHDTILVDGKGWGTIEGAKERTFEKFRTAQESLRQVPGPDTLCRVAVYGTADVVRDLVQTYKLDVNMKAVSPFHPGQEYALQAALLRHNLDTLEALVNLGADVLPLFNLETLEAFLIEGDRDLLHWLNHLIPKMRNKDNAAKARVAFDSVLLSSRAVQCTVVQSNWSLFLGILELRPPLTDEELKPALELAACTRRTEFVLAMLILDREHDNISRETLRHILCQACQPREPDVARKTTFPRYYLGLQPEFIQSVKTPQDIAYGWLIAKMVLHSVATQPKSKIGDLQSFMEKPLFQAAIFNRMPLARWFISDWGADPVRQNEYGETILSRMSYRNSFHAVNYILKLPGASKMIENRSFLGEGPIHLAAAEGNSRIIKMLLNAGAVPTRGKLLDQTVLHLCASLVNKRAFCTLVDHIEQLSPSTLRAMMNHKDRNGATPLHLFLQGSDPNPGTTCKPTSSQDMNMERILFKILKYVDNINTPDEWDLTPLDYLVLFNEDMPKTATLLCRRGADPLRKSSRIRASPVQLVRQGSKSASSMALLEFVVSSPAMMVVLLRQAMTDPVVEFSRVGRLLGDRLQILRQRDAKMREQLQAEFNAHQ
ncbi:hypothetical protein BKA56DRAFT_734054 [Ilyonectria sp. MPI-CAGE-AT-0026]|nr:hypothetical protein BKA56DRAFT_734054 [Ilyonectria sp. MPI-CAGE-AT-0026]